NTLTSLFITQRTLLLGLPIALMVLTKAWTVFSQDFESSDRENSLSGRRGLFGDSSGIFVVGILAGMLPLIHSHTFLVVMAVTGMIALLDWRNWRTWAVFFLGAAISAVPEVLYSLSSSTIRTSSFIGWDIGWDNDDHNVVWFWLLNTGFF